MKNKKEKAWNILFTAPLLFIFSTVVIIPFFIGIFYSFFQWDGIPMNKKVFVGFDNYINLFKDERFMSSAANTFIFTIIAVVVVNVIAMIFSLAVTSKLKVNNTVRTMLFMPNLIGGLILGYIWQYIFTDVFQSIGKMMGLENFFFNWLLDSKYAFIAIIIVFAWQMAGYNMIIYIAGIQSIPTDVVEASRVDGATPWQRFTKITLPLLMPSVTICLFMTLSNSFKIFDVNLSLTGGGPNNATEMFAMNIYNEIFGYNNYGYGQAKAIVFFIIIAVITLTQVSITKKREVQM